MVGRQDTAYSNKQTDYSRSVRTNMRVQAIQSVEDTLSDTFGIISIWKYAGMGMGIFQCEESFTTPKIIPFSDPSKKLHNQTYLFNTQDDRVFFFCQGRNTNRATMVDTSQLMLCIIKENSNQDNSEDAQETLKSPTASNYNLKWKSKNYQDNCQIFPIAVGSELETFLLSQMEEEKRDETTYFQQAAPSIFNFNSNHICVFSMLDTKAAAGPTQSLDTSSPNAKQTGTTGNSSTFKNNAMSADNSSSLAVPYLYFYNLEENQTIKKIAGGELFIEYIPHDFTKGDLFYLTDGVFMKNKLPTKDIRQMKTQMQSSDYQIVYMKDIDFSLDKKDEKITEVEGKRKKRIKITHQQHYKFYSDDMKLSLSRNHVWIKQIKVLRKDKNSIMEFAVFTVNVLTREKKVVIVNIEKCLKNCTAGFSSKKPKTEIISEENAIGIFVTQMRKTDTKSEKDFQIKQSMIQVITEYNDTIQFNFYRREGISKAQQLQIVSEQDSQASSAIYSPANSFAKYDRRQSQLMLFEQTNKSKQAYQCYKKKTFIHKQRGQRIIPMQVIIDDLGQEMTGAFINKDDFSIHWIHEKLSSKKPGRNSQAFQTLPQFQIEFPILCFERPYPDGRELTMINLADQKAARIGLSLSNLKFICFVSHRSPAADRSSICFLARDMQSSQQSDINENQSIVHCIIHCERVFEKKLDKNMSHYDVDIENLGRKAQQKAFQKQLASIVRIESLHDLEAMRQGINKVEQCFIMQTISSVYIYTHYDNDLGQWRRISTEDHMQPLIMQRGFNNKFYYVECDASASSDIIFELHVWISATGKWQWNRKPVFELTSGRAIALELDPDCAKDQMKISSLLKEKNKIYLDRTFANELFVIDEQMQLYQLQEDSDSKTYFSVERQSLAIHKELAPALRYLKTNPWTRASITNKCITIQERTLNFNDEYLWAFSFKDRVEKWKWQVSTCFNLLDTHRQVMLATRKEQNLTENVFVFKLHPSSRKISLVGDKRLQAIKLIEFITKELLLIQMQGNYWCLIDTSGQIREIPPTLHHILKVYQFSQLQTKYLKEKGTILAIFQENTVTFTVEFSHRGEVIGDIQKFEMQKLDVEDENEIEGSLSISADKFGIVYRFSHKMQQGQCGKVQLIKIREAPSDQKIEPESSEDRKARLLENKEKLSFERKQTFSASLVNKRASNILPINASQLQQLAKKQKATAVKDPNLRRRSMYLNDQVLGQFRQQFTSINEKAKKDKNQLQENVQEKQSSFGLNRLETMKNDNQQKQRRLKMIKVEDDKSMLFSQYEYSEQESNSEESDEDNFLSNKKGSISEENSEESEDSSNLTESDIEDKQLDVVLPQTQGIPLQNNQPNQNTKIEKNEPEQEPQNVQTTYIPPIKALQTRKKVIPLCTDTETERTGRIESNRISNGFLMPQRHEFSAFSKHSLLRSEMQDKNNYQSFEGNTKDLKIVDIVFLHEKSEKLEKEVPRVIICGDYLCWQQGIDRTKIYVSKLSSLGLECRNEQGKIKRPIKTFEQLREESLSQVQQQSLKQNSILKRQDQYKLDQKPTKQDKENSTKIDYKRAQELPSKIIDLSPYLVDIKVKDVQISEAPNSTHLSQRTQSELDFSNSQSINNQLLQVTINDRAIIFDLNSYNQTTKKFQALRDISDMKQLIDPERFVCSEFNVQNCYSQPLNSKKPSYRVCRQIRNNKSKDCFFEMQSWSKVNRNNAKKNKYHHNEDQIREPSKVFGIYKTYNETDFEELKRIQKHVKDRIAIRQLDLNVLCSSFLGYSIFSVAQSIQVLKLIQDKLTSYNCLQKSRNDSDDEEDEQLENHFFRRLYQTLMIPIPKLQNKFQGSSIQPQEINFNSKHDLGMFSCLEMIAYSSDSSASEILMKISLLCKQTSVICFADTVDDIRELLRTKMNQTVKLMDHSFFETVATKKIISVTWPKDETFLAFRQNSCLISTDDCIKGIEEAYVQKKSRIEYMYNTLKQKRKQYLQTKSAQNQEKNNLNQLKDHDESGYANDENVMIEEKDTATIQQSQMSKHMTISTVQVRLLDLGWLYANDNVFLDFIDVIQSADYSTDIYASEFIKTLLDVFWNDNETKIFRKIFLPYLVYLAVTLIYMVHIVNEQSMEEQGNWFYLGLINMASVAYQLYIEYIQIKQTNFKEYFTSPMNVLDSFQYFSVFFMIFLAIFSIDFVDSSTRRVWCALLVILMWFKLFDWLRMFNKTAFYISLIVTTVSDILPFFAIFPIFLFAFGSAMFILDHDTGSEGANVLGDYGESHLLNIFINQYLLSLGYFDSLNDYKISDQSGICFFIFVMASFFSEVTALNMIIAIMSDTFTKVTESYEQHSRQMKIGILSDYILHIKKNQNKQEAKNEAQFLAVVTSMHDRQSQNEWEGTLNAVRHSISKHATVLDSLMDQRIQEVKDMMDILQARLTVQDKETKKQINEQNRNIKAISESIAEDVKEVKELLAKQLNDSQTKRN